jgi:hypothetical protein
MQEIRNATHEPLRVPLPQGKVLHLGPLQTGEISDHTLDHPPFKKMVEEGKVEILGEGEGERHHPFKEEKVFPEGD